MIITQRKNKKMRFQSLPIGVIHPSAYQPRRFFDESELISLSESIKRNGLLQPIAVRQSENGMYELIAGERRLRASRMAGLSSVPCMIIAADDRKAALLSIIENTQREQLGIFEEAEAINRLIEESGMSQLDVAQRLGKAQSTIANKLRLLKLSPEERERIISAGLSERHARALLKIPDMARRCDALNEIIAKQYSIIETEKYIEQLLAPKNREKSPPSKRQSVIGDVRIYVNTLVKAVDSIRRQIPAASSSSRETDDYIVYTVKIPKPGTKSRNKSSDQLYFK